MEDILKNILLMGNVKQKYINLFELNEFEKILRNENNKYKLEGYYSIKKFFININLDKNIYLDEDVNIEDFMEKNIDKINFNNYTLIEKEKIKNTFYSILGYIEFFLNNKTRVGVGYGIVYDILYNIFQKPIILEKKYELSLIKQKKYVVTLTYGEVAENHFGMQKIGQMFKEGEGFNMSNLEFAKNNFEKLGFKCTLFDLVKEGGVENIKPTPLPAYVLLIKNGIKALTSTDFNINIINKEVLKDTWDKKAFMRGRVVNKLARYNLNYAEEAQEPDYENKKGRIVAFKDAPIVNKIRGELPKFFGSKANKLYAEGNFYYDLSQCGIGFHGDSERRIVVAVRLGDSSLPIHYQWFQNSKPIGKRIIINLEPGDVYAMSEIAVGTNWKKKLIPTLRHATGSKKFLEIKE
jgi:hypothetical protein